MKQSEMRKFFDKLAGGWEADPAEFDVRETLVEMMRIPGGSTIADIACGRGVMIPHLLKTDPARIIGIDLSGEMIKYAREQHTDERVEFICADLLDASLPPLDAAVIFNSYPHFLDKSSLRVKLAEVVKPGGILIIAHSVSKEHINSRHKSPETSSLSVPLRTARDEAAEFMPEFSPDVCIDTDTQYFIRLIRN